MIKRLILSLVKRWLTKEALEILINELADLLADRAIDAVERLIVLLAQKAADHEGSKATQAFAHDIEQAFKSN